MQTSAALFSDMYVRRSLLSVDLVIWDTTESCGAFVGCTKTRVRVV